jgi:phosphoenolpyruvate synthase/pyruvate phosphate dikinase
MLMREADLAAMVHAGHGDAGSGDGELKGLCVSPGSVEAEVVVMRDPSEFAAMKRGAILVAPATDPSWTPLFTLASGVIVEVGGMLSHASTIAREYGLPALANVKNATGSENWRRVTSMRRAAGHRYLRKPRKTRTRKIRNTKNTKYERQKTTFNRRDRRARRMAIS